MTTNPQHTIITPCTGALAVTIAAPETKIVITIGDKDSLYFAGTPSIPWRDGLLHAGYEHASAGGLPSRFHAIQLNAYQAAAVLSDDDGLILSPVKASHGHRI